MITFLISIMENSYVITYEGKLFYHKAVYNTKNKYLRLSSIKKYDNKEIDSLMEIGLSSLESVLSCFESYVIEWEA